MFSSVVAIACFSALRSTQGARLRKLPDVDDFLTNATTKVHQFEKRTSDIKHEIEKNWEESRSVLSSQKAKYESILKAQEQQSKAIEERIEQVKLGNRQISQMSEDLEANLTSMQEDNRQLRLALTAMGDKVEAANSFIEQSIRATDDTDADVLKVLAPTTQAPTLDSFLAATNDEKKSLLQVEPQSPEAAVDALSNSMSEIEAAEEEGAEMLHKAFQDKFDAGEQKQAALNATLAELWEVRSDLKVHLAKLGEAQEFLEHTHYMLRTRVQALQVFAEKLNLFAVHALKFDDVEPRNASMDVITENLTTGTNGTIMNTSVEKRTTRALRGPQASVGEWFDTSR